MTREEAISILQDEAYFLYEDDVPYNRQAFDMAIQALSQEPCDKEYETYCSHKCNKCVDNECPLREQEPCDDAISRQAALECCRNEWEEEVEIRLKSLPSVTQKSTECDDVVSRILKRMWNCRGKHTTSIDKVKMEQIIRDELPPVTQKQKTGHREYNDIYDHYLCGNCKTVVMDYDNYCPNCGAKMESEDKE